MVAAETLRSPSDSFQVAQGNIFLMTTETLPAFLFDTKRAGRTALRSNPPTLCQLSNVWCALFANAIGAKDLPPNRYSPSVTSRWNFLGADLHDCVSFFANEIESNGERVAAKRKNCPSDTIVRRVG